MLTSVSPTGEPLAITVDTRVDAHSFLYLSYGRDARGELLYGPKDLAPSRELRARWFNCQVRYGGRVTRVALHDQGGAFAVDGPRGRLTIRLRQIQWPTHTRAPALALLAMQGRQQELLIDAPEGLAPTMALAAPDAVQIGMTTGDFEISCEDAHFDYRGGLL